MRGDREGEEKHARVGPSQCSGPIDATGELTKQA